MSESAKDDDSLRLEPVVVTAPRSKRAGYPRSYAEYAEVFGATERTLKHWVKVGKQAQDLPPLEDPPEMPIWWARNMKQRVPQNLLDAATRAAAARNAQVEHHVVAAPMPQTTTASVEGHGFMTMLATKREQVAIAYQALVSAQSELPQDPAKIELATRTWSKLAKELEAAELKAQTFAAKEGRYIDRDVLQKELTSMLAACADSFRSLYRRIKPKLETAQDESEADQIYQAGVDEIFGELIRSGYAQPFTLSA